MPFPLAHPAAVLPFRRHCGQWLSFPALVIGTLVPDAGYLFGEQGMGGLSHRFLGSLAFGMPIGAIAIAALYVFRPPVVELLPTPYKSAFLPLCQRPIASFWIVAISLFIGIWTHILLDSFTHREGWFVAHLSVLQIPIAHYGTRTARLCHVLWYGFSFAGVVWLFLAFEKWKDATNGGVRSTAVLRDGIILAVLVLFIALLHHLILGTMGVVLTTALCALLTIGFTLKTVRRPKVH
jgi:hypothetical protein